MDKGWPLANHGIRKVIIQDKSKRAPGLIKVLVKGGAPDDVGTYSAQVGDEPFYMAVELNDSVSGGAVSQCGEIKFTAEQCTWRTREGMATVKCR